jgi:hypothetical protein
MADHARHYAPLTVASFVCKELNLSELLAKGVGRQ